MCNSDLISYTLECAFDVCNLVFAINPIILLFPNACCVVFKSYPTVISVQLLTINFAIESQTSHYLIESICNTHSLDSYLQWSLFDLNFCRASVLIKGILHGEHWIYNEFLCTELMWEIY